MKIQKEFDPIQGITTVRIEKTREDVTPVVEYKKFISKGIEITNSDGETEVVNQRVEAVLPENGPRSTLFQATLSDGTDVKAAVGETVAKATIEYAEKNGQRSVIEMKYRQPTGEAKAAVEEDAPVSVAKPVISIDEDGNVTITATAGDIHYTTNGSTPTSASTKYTASFSVEDGTTVKAIAIVKEENEETGEVVEKVSAVATSMYEVGPSAPEPAGKYTVYYGNVYVDYMSFAEDNLPNTEGQIAYLSSLITEDVVKGGTKEVTDNIYKDLVFTGRVQDEEHMDTFFYAVPTSAGPIVAGAKLGDELKASGAWPTKTMTIGGVEYTVFMSTTGAIEGDVIEVFFRETIA